MSEISQHQQSISYRFKGLVDKYIVKFLHIPKKLIYKLFHILFYNSELRVHWQGSLALKNPLDLWIYQEILYQLKPDLIIETGTAFGGSAHYLANICDLIGKGQVVTIDIEQMKGRCEHARIKYLLGSSTSDEIVTQVRSFVNKAGKVLVILDSDHSKTHVLKELTIYNQFVSKGSYIIVEDTNINGHPVNLQFGPGPKEAVDEFLKNNENFKPDRAREKLFITYNPGGYLKRVK